MTQRLTEDLKANTLKLVERIAASHKSCVTAASLYGPSASGYENERSDLHILLVLRDYHPQLRAYHRTMKEVEAYILTVDQRAFERDVRKGWLGEFAAEKLTVPYDPLVGGEYLSDQEVEVKRRIVSELLENLIVECPELSYELRIHPEYFMYESMMRRARLFPPLTFRYLNMLRDGLRRKNAEAIMKGYLKALRQLEAATHVEFANGYIRISPKLIRATKSQRVRIPDFLKTFQRAMLFNILSILPKMMQALLHEEELFSESQQSPRPRSPLLQLENPRKYLLMPTPLGSVALSDKTTIGDFVKKAFPNEEVSSMEIEKIGGIINDVYLLKTRRNDIEKKVVVKRFIDWSGFKWFPLALWTLGTKSFAVRGRSRLERHYTMSKFLHSQGFTVPQVLYVSLQDRLIFEEFVNGETLVETIKRIIASQGEATTEIALVKATGQWFAEAHRFSISLGDSKPENIVATGDGRIYFVDFEQATRDGDQVWDIAEFLYYSGHYVSPVSPATGAEVIAKELINGYIAAGGKAETIKKAGSSRYAKVFGIFTPLHVILAISSVCKTVGKT